MNVGHVQNRWPLGATFGLFIRVIILSIIVTDGNHHLVGATGSKKFMRGLLIGTILGRGQPPLVATAGVAPAAAFSTGFSQPFAVGPQVVAAPQILTQQVAVPMAVPFAIGPTGFGINPFANPFNGGATAATGGVNTVATASSSVVPFATQAGFNGL